MVSGGFFHTLGVNPMIGRLFTRDHDNVEMTEAVVSYNYWQQRFGGSFDVLGKTFALRKALITIVGVTPPGFIGENAGQQPDVWLPLRLQQIVIPRRDRLHDTPPEKSMWLHEFGRLKQGAKPVPAAAQGNTLLQYGLKAFDGASLIRPPELLEQRLPLDSAACGASDVRKEFSHSLNALLAAVVILLLIACANIANLLLAHGAARKPEIALRVSLGANRGRLIRQLI